MPSYRYEFRRGLAVDYAEVDLPDSASAWKQAIRAYGEALQDLEATFVRGEALVLVVHDQDGAPVGLIECRTG